MSIRLRSIRDSELQAFLEARLREAASMGFPFDSDADAGTRLRERIRRSGHFEDGELMLAIEERGRLVGEVQARQPEHGLPPGVFELGISVFDERDRGRGIGRRAVAAITRRLFSEEGAHRVQLTTDVDNAPMRGAAERLGFVHEGVLRSFMPSPEGPRDYAIYAMTRDDWERERGRWTTGS